MLYALNSLRHNLVKGLKRLNSQMIYEDIWRDLSSFQSPRVNEPYSADIGHFRITRFLPVLTYFELSRAFPSSKIIK